jgi:hypothetical protein
MGPPRPEGPPGVPPQGTRVAEVPFEWADMPDATQDEKGRWVYRDEEPKPKPKK